MAATEVPLQERRPMVSRRTLIAGTAALGVAGLVRPSFAQQAPWAAR
jgi:hypothetical protein